jgi:hypothetical protein
MKTVLHPTAGYIANCQANLLPSYQPSTFSEDEVGALETSEKLLLRDLAKKVVEIAALPEQYQKRESWYRLCDLKRTRPMMLVFPEDSWTEIIPPESMVIKDGFWAQIEWYLRHLIYRYEHVYDDFVTEPEIILTKAIRRSGWGVETKFIKKDKKGSYVWEPSIKNESDIDKLHMPEVEVCQELSDRNINLVKEILGDIIEVKQHCFLPLMLTYETAALFRGIEQLMLDMYDRPKFVHRLMNIISEGICKEAEFLQANGHLTLNNRGHYVDSGGIAYTKTLPAADYDGIVRFKDLWGFGVAQAATGVSPAMHEEFILQYDLKLLQHCGLVSYGCCEPYTHKFTMLKKNVRNLRRVSVSSWCDPKRAAEELQDKYIYSCKPSPAFVTEFDEDAIRKSIRRKLEIAKDCVLEIILKDLTTLQNDPSRITMWTNIVREEIERTV